MSNDFDFSNSSMLDLFRLEVEMQAEVLNNGLIKLEKNPSSTEDIESLMRSAHSIKGAARIVQIDPIVKLSHALEDCFVAVQESKLQLEDFHIDILLKGADVYLQISKLTETEIPGWLKENINLINETTELISSILNGESKSIEKPKKEKTNKNISKEKESEVKINEVSKVEEKIPQVQKDDDKERILRISTQNLNRLIGLTGEQVVQSHRLFEFIDSLNLIKLKQNEIIKYSDKLKELIENTASYDLLKNYLEIFQKIILNEKQNFAQLISDIEIYANQGISLSNRMYRESLSARMRPFSEIAGDFPRMVRDIAKSLNKKVNLVIEGLNTKVDRDILEKLKAPLTHLIRNSVDHGIETIEERTINNKNPEGTILIETFHRSGMLIIIIKDDGKGINYEKLKEKIIDKKLTTKEMVFEMSNSELLEFLFLPGFSTAHQVTEISGRGVGLDIVQSMVQEVGGLVKVESETGKGISFQLQLPLTLSVLRTLLVEIAGETYAFPLTRITRVLTIPISEIKTLENKQYIVEDSENVGIITAHQIFNLARNQQNNDLINIIIISDRLNRYGLIVDNFIEERNLVVQSVDSRLGKLQNINSFAMIENSAPTVIIDVDDLIRSIDILLNGGRLAKIGIYKKENENIKKKRILVVDDSLTVREIERKLLENNGYDVDVAINGMDGWNAVRTGNFDLVISDIDMPRMNGIELVTNIKHDPVLKNLPVVIVSYKDREEDRMKGMEAGADYYLTKSSFHDETLINVVIDLIGEAV